MSTTRQDRTYRVSGEWWYPRTNPATGEVRPHGPFITEWHASMDRAAHRRAVKRFERARAGDAVAARPGDGGH